MVFIAALAASQPSVCAPALAAGETVMERRALSASGGALEAVSVGDPNADPPWTRVIVFGGRCQVNFERRFGWMTQARFSEGMLDRQPFLFVTTFGPGGSACHYDHLILAYGGRMDADDGVLPLAPMPLAHDNMDGLFVGNLGRGRGYGLVTWSALWNGDGHYSPHPYEIVTYRWRDGRFVGPTLRRTARKYTPVPDSAAARLNLGFRDLTQQERFGGC